jgi:hypothetical protein
MKTDPHDFLLPDGLRQRLQEPTAPAGLAGRLQERAALPLAQVRATRRRRFVATLAAGVLGFATSLGGQALLQASLEPTAPEGLRMAQEDAPGGLHDLRELLPPPAATAPGSIESSLRALAELQGAPR